MDAMLQCLHFRDNAKIDDDGYFKVRPIFANLNKAGHWFVDEGQFSVDEVMIHTSRRHSSKQFIHGKPIGTVTRFGPSAPVADPECGLSLIAAETRGLRTWGWARGPTSCSCWRRHPYCPAVSCSLTICSPPSPSWTTYQRGTLPAQGLSGRIGKKIYLKNVLEIQKKSTNLQLIYRTKNFY
jgi:hypothetical protein